MNISIGVNKTFLRNLLLEHILDILGRFIQLQVPKVKFNSIPNQSRSINVPNVSVKATWQSNFVSTERGTQKCFLTPSYNTELEDIRGDICVEDFDQCEIHVHSFQAHPREGGQHEIVERCSSSNTKSIIGER